MSTASSDEKQLSDKAKSVVRARFSKPKDVPHVSDVSKPTELLEALHQRARKANSTETIPFLSLCSLFVAKLLISSHEALVLQTYQASLVDFATRKASALNTSFFLDFIRRYPSSAWSLRSSILECVAKATNGFRQCHVFEFVQALITAQPPETQGDEILAYMALVSQALVQAASRSCVADKPLLSVAQMKDMLKVGLQLIRYTKKISPESSDLTKIWNVPSWEKATEELGQSASFKAAPSLKNLSQQIVQIAKASSSSGLKPGKKKKSDKDSEQPTLKRKTGGDGEGDAKSEASQDKAKRKKSPENY